MKCIIVSHFGITKRDIASRRIANLCTALDYQNQNVTLLTSDISCDSNELYELKNRLIKISSRNLAFASKMKHFARDALDSSRVFRKEGTSFRSQFTILAKRFLKSIFADPYNTVSDSLAKDRFLRIDGRSYLETIHGYIDNKGIVILLTSAGPAIMHRIGYEIKKRFPQVFWIADYRDQIVGNPVAKATPRMRKANYLAIKNADMIAAVSEGLVNDIAKYSPVGKEAVLVKSYTLYNGFASKSAAKTKKSLVDSQRIRIAYTGVLYSMRRIDYLIRGIKEVNSSLAKFFELFYCGSSSSIVERMVAEEAANSFVTNKGFVSKQEAEKEQDEADILLLLKSNEPESGGMTGLDNFLNTIRIYLA